MKKWVWITVPAVAVALGVVFVGGSVFAQTPGNTATPSVNWTAMYDYCRSVITGNDTATAPNWTAMRGMMGNWTGNMTGGMGAMMGGGNFTGGMMGNGADGINGCGNTAGSNITGGMMGSRGGMMGNRSFGGGMMGW